MTYTAGRHDILILLLKARRAHDEVLRELDLVDDSSRIEQLERRMASRREALTELGIAVLYAALAGDDAIRLTPDAVSTEVWPEDLASGESVEASSGLDEPPPTVSRQGSSSQEGGSVPRPPARRVVRRRAVTPPPARGPDLSALAGGGIGPNWEDDDERRQARHSALVRALERVGPPVDVKTPAMFTAEVDRLARSAEHAYEWNILQTVNQRTILGLCVAKARHLQDEASQSIRSEASQLRLEQVFPTLTRYSATERPGYVHGLSRRHRPEGAPTWYGVALRYWTQLAPLAGMTPEEAEEATPDPNPERSLDRLRHRLEPGLSAEQTQEAFVEALEGGLRSNDPRLVRIAAPWIDALVDEPRLKQLRRAVRESELLDEEEEDEEEISPPPIPEDWPWLFFTHGRRIVVVGGDAREEAAQRIEEAFGAKSVEWESDCMGRRLDAVTERIKNKSVDLIIFLARFGTHRAQGQLLDACKEAEVPFVRIERGYGVTQIRLAIENSLTPPF